VGFIVAKMAVQRKKNVRKHMEIEMLLWVERRALDGALLHGVKEGECFNEFNRQFDRVWRTGFSWKRTSDS